MPTPIDFIDGILSHDYDPEARRAYYLRTRQLKGRLAAKEKSKVGKSSAVVKSSPKKKTSAQLTAQAKKRHIELEIKLQKLKDLLQRLVNEAKRDAGTQPVSKTSKTSTTTSKSSSKDSGKTKADKKPLTAHQKAEAAKKAKLEYAKVHPDSLQKQIKDIRTQITDMRAKIKLLQAHSKSKAPKTKTA